MSNKSWLAEFYPENTLTASHYGPLHAISHSLRKWQGATKENLEKHELEVPPIPFNGGSCALCEAYYNYSGPRKSACVSCPIFKVKGRDCMEEFRVFAHSANPQPMIRLLTKVEEAYDNEPDKYEQP